MSEVPVLFSICTIRDKQFLLRNNHRDPEDSLDCASNLWLEGRVTGSQLNCRRQVR